MNTFIIKFYDCSITGIVCVKENDIVTFVADACGVEIGKCDPLIGLAVGLEMGKLF